MTVPTMKTIQAAADETGLSYDYIRRLIFEGKITYVRAGRKFMVNMEKLVAFLNDGEKAPEV